MGRQRALFALSNEARSRKLGTHRHSGSASWPGPVFKPIQDNASFLHLPAMARSDEVGFRIDCEAGDGKVDVFETVGLTRASTARQLSSRPLLNMGKAGFG
jgi:hypothetical protein